MFDDLPEKWSFELAKQYQYFPLRDKKFLDWKVFAAPESIRKDLLVFWFLKGKERIGYGVFYHEKRRNRLKILDILCTNAKENLVDCFRAVKHFAITHRYDVVITNMSSNLYITAAKRGGFIKSEPVRCNIFSSSKGFFRR